MSLPWVIIDSQTNIVDNIIEWDGKTKWLEPAGFYKINVEGSTTAHIGSIYDKVAKTFTAAAISEPVAPPEKPKPTLESLQAQLAAITAQMATLANTGQ